MYTVYYNLVHSQVHLLNRNNTIPVSGVPRNRVSVTFWSTCHLDLKKKMTLLFSLAFLNMTKIYKKKKKRIYKYCFYPLQIKSYNVYKYNLKNYLNFRSLKNSMAVVVLWDC